ncbi:MAG: hypothetical protein K9M11_03900 [Candidatus Pacebacteria bacterium]|nr:hypothetical protein [Candidatus Paceibacterota bacterium]
MKFLYLKLLFAIYFIPVIVLFSASEGSLDILKLSLFTFIIVIYGIAWDMWATKHGRTDKVWVWRFNPKTITGVYVDHHPLDEYVFGVLHIFWVIFLWEILNQAIFENNNALLIVPVVVILWQIGVGYVFYKMQKR